MLDEVTEAEDPELEWKLCAGAIPAMFCLALLFHAFELGHFAQRTFLTMPVHEFGHAVTAWFCGFAAMPTLWHTNVAGSRGLGMPLVLLAALAFMTLRAWRAENFALAGLGGALILLQGIGTLYVKEEKARMLITFGGDGAGMVLAVALIACFYFGKGTQMVQGGLRWGFLAIGTAAFVDIYATWWGARRDSGMIPYGEQEGGLLSDATRLVDEFGWTDGQLVQRYVALGACCLAAVALVYAWGLWRARRAATD